MTEATESKLQAGRQAHSTVARQEDDDDGWRSGNGRGERGGEASAMARAAGWMVASYILAVSEAEIFVLGRFQIGARLYCSENGMLDCKVQ